MAKTIKGTVLTSLECYFAAAAALEQMAKTIKGTVVTSLERYFAAAASTRENGFFHIIVLFHRQNFRLSANIFVLSFQIAT